MGGENGLIKTYTHNPLTQTIEGDKKMVANVHGSYYYGAGYNQALRDVAAHRQSQPPQQIHPVNSEPDQEPQGLFSSLLKWGKRAAAATAAWGTVAKTLETFPSLARFVPFANKIINGFNMLISPLTNFFGALFGKEEPAHVPGQNE